MKDFQQGSGQVSCVILAVFFILSFYTILIYKQYFQ